MAEAIRRRWILALGLFVLIGIGAGVALALARLPASSTVALEQNPVRQGGQVRVSGGGFYPLEPVSIQVTKQKAGSKTLNLGQIHATSRGSLAASYVALPQNLASGAHTLRAVGEVSHRQSTVVLYVRAPAPWVTLGSSEAKPRAELGLIAGGFAPGEHLRVSLAPPKGSSAVKASNLADLPTDRVGNTAWVQVRLPLVPPGHYQIVVRGESSGQELKKSLDLKPYQPSLQLSPWAGPPGTKVQLNARGFEPGEKVQVYLGGSAKSVATVVADRYGNLWGAGPVKMPYSDAATTLTVKLVGTDSKAWTEADFKVLKPKPWLQLTQYWGAPGGSVEFSGGGWAAGERIAFHIGSAKSPAVAYGTADDYGWLHNAGPVTVPKDAIYQITFVAVGESSHSVATATFKIVLPFGISPVGRTPVATPRAS